MKNKKTKEQSMSLSLLTQNEDDKSINFNSDNENVYLPLKYPADEKYNNYIKTFLIKSQDKKEAGSSRNENSNIENEEFNEKCGNCEIKFTKKTYSVYCTNCKKWFCLTCSKLSKKEAGSLKKNRAEWICIKCNDQNNNNNENYSIEEENILLKKCIININQKMDFLVKEVKELKYLTSKMLDEKEKNSVKQKDYTYSQIVQKLPENQITSNIPVLIIKPKNKQTSRQTKIEVQNAVNPITVQATVKKVKEINNGGIIIQTNNEEELEKVRKLSEYKLKEHYNIEVSKMKPPKLVLLGVSKKYDDEELIEELKALKYIDIQDKLTIKHTRQSKISKKYIIYLETSGRTFSKLVNKDISLGWNTCKIREDFNIFICHKCCGYGHTTKYCSRNQICSFCSGTHTYYKCYQEKSKCINCSFMNTRYNKSLNCNHEANSIECNIHLQKIQEARERTNYK